MNKVSVFWVGALHSRPTRLKAGSRLTKPWHSLAQVSLLGARFYQAPVSGASVSLWNTLGPFQRMATRGNNPKLKSRCRLPASEASGNLDDYIYQK